ncbi:MAG: glycosyltransferase, partial [bacterium]|nr:glycosyltransferase [bacterium]
MKNKKFKICYVASSDMTLKFILFSHLQFLARQGYQVHAVCAPGKWVKDIEAEGIKVKTIGFKRQMLTPVSDIVSFFRLYFYFQKEGFDIVHTHTLKPAFYGQMAAKIADVPIIINTLHGLDFAEDSSLLKKKFILFIEKIAAKSSDLVFSVSKKALATILREKALEPSKITYLGNGINTLRFNPLRFSQDFIQNKKKQLGIDPNKKVIGIVARLVAEKGYLELFSAFK